MRVTRQMRRSDRGAVLVVMTAFLVVAVLFLAFVIDIGNQRQNRRQLTTATDAAALAVIQEWVADKTAVNPADCSSTAAPYVTANNSGVPTDSVSCVIVVGSTYAVATVNVDEAVDFEFEGITGVAEGDTASSSSVRASAEASGGVRPFTICSKDPQVQSWIDDPARPSGFEVVVTAEKFLPNECEQNNGNWGFVQFPSSSGGASGAAYEVEFGTSDAVYIAGPTPNCKSKVKDYRAKGAFTGPDPLDCLMNVTGSGVWNNNGTGDAFETLIDDKAIVFLPVYGQIEDFGGNGSVTGFPVVGFAKVQIYSYEKGQSSSGGSVGIRFLEYLTEGPCCGLTEENSSYEICDVGTAQGAVSADFASRCLGEESSPPPGPPPGSEDPECTGASVNPSFVEVTLTEDEELSSAVSYDVAFDDATACANVEVHAMRPGRTATATLSGPTGNVFTATFPAGTELQKNKTFTIEVSVEESVVNDSAELKANGAPKKP